VDKLSDDKKDFLLSLVAAGGDCDYYESVDGWPLWVVEDDVLTIEFESNDDADGNRTLTWGQWTLTYSDGGFGPKIG
jgi:hypothetical protein